MAELAALGAMMAGAGELAAVAAPVIGTAVSVAGTLAGGKSAQSASNYEAQQRDVQAKEERAAAQREAEQFRRRKELALSSLQTRAGASGFSATDPTALTLAGDIEEYGTVQEQMAQYGGESRAQGRMAEAAAARFEGANARAASKYKAATTILGGVDTLAMRFGQRGGATSSAPYRYG